MRKSPLRAVLLAALAALLPTTGCAIAQETLDLAEETTERTLWYLEAVDVVITAFTNHINAHPELLEFDVAFNDGTSAAVKLKREDALAELKKLQDQIAPVRDSLVRLNTNIQKGRTMAEFLAELVKSASPKELLLKLLPGLVKEVTTLLPDETASK